MADVSRAQPHAVYQRFYVALQSRGVQGEEELVRTYAVQMD
jgi:hypothetical protein